MRPGRPPSTSAEPTPSHIPGGRRPEARRALIATAGLVAAFLLLRLVAFRGTDLEFSIETIERARNWIHTFGWLGPAVFIAIVALRPFLLLSSHVVLTLGGLTFGPWAGTLWGAVGLMICAAYQFGFARFFGDAWVRPRLGARALAAELRMQRAGPWLVGIASAHPLGVMTPVHLGAGLVGVSAARFAVAVAFAAPIRAGIYSALGASVLEWGLGTSLALAAGLGVLTFAPLMSPTARRWIFLTDENAGEPRGASRETPMGAP